MPTNQEPYNENNERDGLWVRYYDGEDSIMYRGAYVNGNVMDFGRHIIPAMSWHIKERMTWTKKWGIGLLIE